MNVLFAALSKKTPFMFRNSEKLAVADQGQFTIVTVIAKLQFR